MKRRHADITRRRRPREEVAPLRVPDYAKLRADLEEAEELADTTLKAYRCYLQRPSLRRSP